MIKSAKMRQSIIISGKFIQMNNHMIGIELHEKSIDLGTLTVT